MARKTEDFLMIFLGVLMIGQYTNVQAEDYEGPLSVAEEEVLGKNAMADVEAESADAVSEPLRDPFWPVGYRPDGGSVDRETTSSGDLSGDFEEAEAALGFSGFTAAGRDLLKTRIKIAGILRQPGGCVSIINDQLLKEGDTLFIEAEGRKYQFLLKMLTPQRVLLESLN